jgi:sarcosine oxidase gamma subunit
MEPFVQEFELLDNLCARDVRLSARAPKGVVADMVRDLVALGPDEWRLPDLPYGGEGWALLRLLVSKEAHSEVDKNGHLTVLELSASFQDMEGECHELPKGHCHVN